VTPQDVFNAVVGIRQQKLPDPAVIPNVGSFFKNPVVSGSEYQALRERYPDLVAYPQQGGRYKLAAGWMIDRCGWKGRSVGPVRVHDRQALVLTNTGGSTAADILKMATMIQQDVYAKFAVRLEIEPVCWFRA
jgi:UDP-N-acetylmuramate dehydrogenase